MKVLHVALEFNAKVGGLGAVTTGLLPELSKNGVETFIVTPFFSAYKAIYQECKLVAAVKHIFNGEIQTSEIYEQQIFTTDGSMVTHYLVNPIQTSLNGRLFEIDDPIKLYIPFEHSDPNDRRQYFNSAVASLIRTDLPSIPHMDIVHLHTWHTALTGCLVKEFENLINFQELLPAESMHARKIPHIYFTTHMLLEREHGYLRTRTEIQKLIKSLGLPCDFIESFAHFSEHIRQDHFRMHALGLLYADQVSIVSKSVLTEVFNGVPHGLLDIFKQLRDESRLIGITNGVPCKEWDATSKDNLGDFTLNLNNIVEGKQAIKNHLATKYPSLNPNKNWFMFVGRFANEKGIDLLPTALQAIRDVDGQLIVMGVHISKDRNNAVSRIIESFYDQPDVVVIEEPAEQQIVGKLVRAASQFTVITSNNETCGLVPMEQQLSASIPIAAKVQGLPDSVIPFTAHYSVGTGFLFDYEPSLREDYLKKNIDPNTPERVQLRRNLYTAIVIANQTYNELLTENKLNTLLARIMVEAQRFDWGATPVNAYVKSYQCTIDKPVMTYNQIRGGHGQPLLNRFNSLAFQDSKPKRRVFQIGFNKCGTWSLHDYFDRNGIESVHYAPVMVSKMFTNLKKNQPIIPAELHDKVGFFDLENIYDSRRPLYLAFFFKELDQQNPGSKFILNTRDREKWIKSRLNHKDENNGKYYYEYLSERYGLTKIQLIDKWRREWDAHHSAVLEYFKDRPQDLLVFDIERHGGQELADFLKSGLDIETNPSLYRHLNKNLDLACESNIVEALKL